MCTSVFLFIFRGHWVEDCISQFGKLANIVIKNVIAISGLAKIYNTFGQVGQSFSSNHMGHPNVNSLTGR